MIAPIRFVEGDIKTLEFQLLTIDPDTPHVPEPINLTNYDSVIFRAKQIGPIPTNPTTFSAKTITITGTFVAPLAQGYVQIPFTASNLDTPGEYECRIVLIKTGTEIWSNKYDFRMNVRESF